MSGGVLSSRQRLQRDSLRTSLQLQNNQITSSICGEYFYEPDGISLLMCLPTPPVRTPVVTLMSCFMHSSTYFGAKGNAA